MNLKRGYQAPFFLSIPYGNARMRITEFLKSFQTHRPFVVVLGHPVGHSLSPQIHNLAARHHNLNVIYHAVDCHPDDWGYIPDLLAHSHFRGGNVTIPLKKKIIDNLDAIDESALEIGAVNTIVPEPGGSSGTRRLLKGYNTDAFGFMKPLEGISDIKNVTVLGSGGAFNAVRYVLNRIGAEKIFLIRRTLRNGKESGKRDYGIPVETLTYADIEKAVTASDLIVNTTPVGMYPDTDGNPLPEAVHEHLKGKICYDIIYNPLVTNFLKVAKENGAKTIGGLDMFVHQAARAFELWFSLPMPVDKVRKLVVDTIHSGKQSE